ncbi:acyl carrier protein, mitochondrial [Parasteatoda tepidariorum]|uniref:acyl carrier protein, mitochondrial n=1 Tax=Parasteatoda tepidariorum TaxID=114398 RepID=UPI0039BC418A
MGSSAIRLRFALANILNVSRKIPHVSCNVTRTYLISSLNLYKSCSYPLGNSYFCGKVFANLTPSVRNFSSDEKFSSEEVTQKVLHVCKTFDKIPADKLTLDSHFMNDLGLDSLDHVELIMNIEDDFNFEIPDADAEKLLRVKDIIEYIIQKGLSAAE